MRINPITNGTLLPGRQHLGRARIVKTLLVLFLIPTLEKLSFEYINHFFTVSTNTYPVLESGLGWSECLLMEICWRVAAMTRQSGCGKLEV